MKTIHEISRLLPSCLTEYLTDQTEEIRFRRNCPVIFGETGKEIVTPHLFDANKMENLVDQLTEGSLSSYFHSMKDGFITVQGGHRVGLCGTAVYEGSNLTFIKDISSVNLRIAKEILGAADRLIESVGQLDPFPGILIVSPPGQGKTTLLRDLIRQVSERQPGVRISVVDERGEIAATYQGEAQNRLGNRCDILNGYHKSDAIPIAIRTLSPTVIAVDEIGTPSDEESLLYAHHCGVSVVATIHGNGSGNFRKKIRRLTEEHVFSYEVYLSKNNTDDRIERMIKVESG